MFASFGLDTADVVIDSMKKMFGMVPCARYGWPKNILHWKSIQKNTLDICAAVPCHFVIADGIVAMEGNGPLNGTPRRFGKVVLASRYKWHSRATDNASCVSVRQSARKSFRCDDG